MEKLPKSLRDAMTGQPPAGPHPDADLLTAFSEGSATPQERESVLMHLASCRECREVLALAMPEVAAETGAQPEISRREVHTKISPLRRWLWVPALGAAAVVAISATLLLHREERNEQRATETAAVSSKPSQAVTAVPSPVDETRSNEAVASPKAPTAPAKTVRPAEVAAGTAGKESLAREPLAKKDAAENDTGRDDFAEKSKTLAAKEEREQVKQMATAKTVAGDAASRSASRTGDMAANRAESNVVAGASGPAAFNTQSLDMRNNTANAPVERSLQDEDKKIALRRQAAPAAAPLGQPDTQGFGPSRQVVGGALAKAVAPAVRPNWRISGNGQIERSYDNRSWTPMLTDSKFRVVAVIGNDVWAGGDAGILFHSADNGEHWTRVETPLKAAIIGISFQDAQHGTVRSDSGERWTTSDRGATWVHAQ